jgi:hypothetical protein
MNTYNWRIMSMDVRPQLDGQTDVVVRAQWEITATDPVVGDTAGTQGFTQFSVPSGSFTPYDSLTEAQVIGWVQGAMGPSQILELEAFVDNLLITNRLPPITQLPLPWA